MNFPGWFVEIRTEIGSMVLPFGHKGYRTKKEAEYVASEFTRVSPETISAEVKQYKSKK